MGLANGGEFVIGGERHERDGNIRDGDTVGLEVLAQRLGMAMCVHGAGTKEKAPRGVGPVTIARCTSLPTPV
jgi:hypothetical protein